MGSAVVAEESTSAEHAARAWQFFRSIGSPKYHVAPMVDQVGLCADKSSQCASYLHNKS